MRKLFVILLVAFIPIFSLNAEIIDCQPLFGDVMKQYMKAEWNISLIEKWDNPYDQEQIALDMIFISPDGSKGVLPCFFVDGESGKQSLWKARFAAKQTGVYQIYFDKGFLTGKKIWWRANDKYGFTEWAHYPDKDQLPEDFFDKK